MVTMLIRPDRGHSGCPIVRVFSAVVSPSSASTHLLNFLLKVANAFRELKNDFNPSEIHTQVLDEPPDLLSPSDIVDGIQADPPLRARGCQESLTLVRSQRLGVHSQHPRGDANRKIACPYS